MTKMNIAKVLLTIEDGIFGALNTPEVLRKLALFGYAEEQITEGKKLLEKAKQMLSIQVEEYSDQYAATDALSKEWAVVYPKYMITLKVVRIAFKGKVDMLARFKATGKRRKSFSGWLMDTIIFYTNLLDTPVALERMSRFGYTVERLQEEFAAVKELEILHSRKLTEKGEAQQSTVERDKVLDELYDWYSDFRAIARVALYDTPQLLEALGIVKK